MIFPSGFAGQNWLITPADWRANEIQPVPAETKWLLVLTGVAVIDFRGNASTWRHDSVTISPDLQAPLAHAVGRGWGGGDFLGFQVEQWAPHAAPNAMFNRNHSVNSGFAVDAWRPVPFSTLTPPGGGAAVGNIFAGIIVDLAVSDTDAILHRVSYHITLLGRIKPGITVIF